MQTSIAVVPQTAAPSRQALAAQDRSAPRQVTGKLKRALDLMVWERKTDSEAAVTVKMNVLSIRNAMQKAHVRAYYIAQRDVLRTRECAANIHTLIDVRDQTSNQMARVQAVKALEQLEDQPQSGRSAGQVAGFVIQVINNPAPLTGDQASIEAKPLKTIDDVSQGDHKPTRGPISHGAD